MISAFTFIDPTKMLPEKYPEMPKPDDWSMQAERAAKMQQADLAVRQMLRKAREEERRGLLNRADRERALKFRRVRHG